ncbi:MAG: Na(+)/H(+) antiporter subunit D, partial [Desulfobacterales bacterium CG23_combo_of_CG06-09_8_20_14_all_51_8]
MNLSNFFHPSIAFIALAFILLLVKSENNKAWRWLLPIPPMVALISIIFVMKEGVYGVQQYLSLDLTFGRVDKLSLVFANIFALQALIGMLFALHLKDRAQHFAACFYIAGAFGCVFAGDYVTLFIFWEMMSVASTFLVWLNRSERSTQAGFRYFLFHTF